MNSKTSEIPLLVFSSIGIFKNLTLVIKIVKIHEFLLVNNIVDVIL